MASPPPTYDQAMEGRDVLETATKADGRIDIDPTSRLSKALTLLIDENSHEQQDHSAAQGISPTHHHHHRTFPLKLNIVIQVVGSRGDVQPFIALGNALQEHGHRVRLATHQKFENLVDDSGLEFFAIGGDPADLMAYMVKNPGLMPSMQSLRAGDVNRKRDMVAEMLDGCWRSCIQPDLRTGSPFVADAIVANPPSFAHVHCAEALGIPVHIVFTMPWSRTGAFAHPLANVKAGFSDPQRANLISYPIVSWLTWQGLADLINGMREKLGLARVPGSEGPMLAETLKIPHTYCWSPALIPKPSDWGSHIDISGFFFRETPDYTPSRDLSDFLAAGPAPIYVGFGSIVLEDTQHFSNAIVAAVARCGVRAIVSLGWTKLEVPTDRSDIFCLEECPHEWLFPRVSMVVHHGGAGTTTIGLREARPTIIVPFFGDQPFWADMVAAAGAGPKPIPQQQVTSETLAEAIRFCMTVEAQDAAARLSTQIKQEDGVRTAVESFHRNLPLQSMRCDILSDQPACWSFSVGRLRKPLKVSRPAATVLMRDAARRAEEFKLYHSNPVSIIKRRWDPVTAIFSSLIGTSRNIVEGAAGVVLEPGKELRRGKQRSLSPRSIRAGPPTNKEGLSREESGTVESTQSTNSSERGRRDRPGPDFSVPQSMAIASGKAVGKTVTSSLRGVLVDLPLATAEGFRYLPHLWGSEVKSYGSITDFQSGALVGGKSLVCGVGSGVRDVIMHPVHGAQESGVLGAVKGVATGVGSLASGTMSAGVGVVAYPGQGIAKSLHKAFHGSTAKQIADAMHSAGSWQAGGLDEHRRRGIVGAFSALKGRRSKHVLVHSE